MALQETGRLTEINETLKMYDHHHYIRHPRLYKIKLGQFWTGLNIVLLMYGIILAAITLMNM